MIEQRRWGDNEPEYKCMTCGWWWGPDSYAVGYFAHKAVTHDDGGAEEENGDVDSIWACDFCIVQALSDSGVYKTGGKKKNKS